MGASIRLNSASVRFPFFHRRAHALAPPNYCPRRPRLPAEGGADQSIAVTVSGTHGPLTYIARSGTVEDFQRSMDRAQHAKNFGGRMPLPEHFKPRLIPSAPGKCVPANVWTSFPPSGGSFPHFSDVKTGVNKKKIPTQVAGKAKGQKKSSVPPPLFCAFDLTSARRRRGHAVSQDAQRKRLERSQEIESGWLVVAVLDHKDNYTSPINSNPRYRARAQLLHLRDPHNHKPPKNYKNEVAEKILLSADTLVTVMWWIPNEQKCIIGRLQEEETCVRDTPDGVRVVRWKYPRYVITTQEEGSRSVMEEIWRKVREGLGEDTRELFSDEAHAFLSEEIVEISGCFYYGPHTQKWSVKRTVNGICRTPLT